MAFVTRDQSASESVTESRDTVPAPDSIQPGVEVAGVEVVPVDADPMAAVPPELRELAEQTGGSVFSGTSPEAVADAVVDAIVSTPTAWAGGPYVTTLDTPIVFDGSQSWDRDGRIVKYEWDLDGDRSVDVVSSTPTYTHVFSRPFDGKIWLRVTDDRGLTDVASVRAHASVDGDEVPDTIDNCPTATNFDQPDADEDGIGDTCDSKPLAR